MTTASLVHSALGWTRPAGRRSFHLPRLRPGDAALWRAIGVGLAAALLGLAMMVMAFDGRPPAAQLAHDPSMLQAPTTHQITPTGFPGMVPLP